MKRISVVAATIALMSALAFSHGPALAQQKTVKACEDEWRANRAANQAKGITQKAYVAECRGPAAATAPKPEPATAPKTTATPAAPKTTAAPASGQKTVKACQTEWRADKAANQAKGITEKAYVAQCRSGTAAAPAAPAAPARVDTPAPAPAPAAPARTTAPAPAPPPAPAAPSRATAPAPAPAPAATAASGPNHHATEALAKARCGSDLVVWANLDSKIYHFAGHSSYGHTKQGAYMCEKAALAEGVRAAKNEKRP